MHQLFTLMKLFNKYYWLSKVGTTYSWRHTLDPLTYIVEQLVVELDGHAGGEEHHHLLLPVLLQEGKQQQEPFLRGTHHVALL